jgi:hypothetical protein
MIDAERFKQMTPAEREEFAREFIDDLLLKISVFPLVEQHARMMELVRLTAELMATIDTPEARRWVAKAASLGLVPREMMI